MRLDKNIILCHNGDDLNVCADVRSYEAGQDQKRKNIRGQRKWGNHKKVQERRLKWFAMRRGEHYVG